MEAAIQILEEDKEVSEELEESRAENEKQLNAEIGNFLNLLN